MGLEPLRAVRLSTAPMRSPQVSLEPLGAHHAEELAPLLGDIALYRFIGGEAPDLGRVRAQFARQSRGASPDSGESWLNWIVRVGADKHAVGTVQATVTRTAAGPEAELAWVIATAYQGQGFAKAAAALVARWLRQRGVPRLCAHIHRGHLASESVAEHLGLRPTEHIVHDERRWQSSCR